MAPHSSILAWKIPWTEESGGLLPMRLQRVGHDCGIEHTYARTHTHTHLCIYLSLYICILYIYIYIYVSLCCIPEMSTTF